MVISMLTAIRLLLAFVMFFFFQAEDGIRDADVTGVQTCALPILGLGRRGRLLVPARTLRRHAEPRRQADRPGRDRVGRRWAPRSGRGGGDRRAAQGKRGSGVDLLRPHSWA